MKAEIAGAIVAQVIGLIAMLIYLVVLQHLYAELLHEPDRSWVNQARAWWVTRGSRKIEKRLRVYYSKETAEEP